MIIRHLQPEDHIPTQYWPVVDVRPGPLSLVSVDDGKITGILWLADGGDNALIGVFLSADPKSAWPLCNAARSLSHDRGCKALICHVPVGRLLDAFKSRDGVVTESNTYIVSFYTGRR